MTFVGMYAEMSPALVSMIGSAVSDPPPSCVGELRRALEQAAVEVEDVAGVGLAARRATQQQRELAVRLGLLGEVVVDDERVLAVLHPVLAHRATRVGREVLERRRLGGGRRDDDRVLEGAVLLEGRDGLGDRRALLADRDVDALHALCRAG